MVPIKVTTTNEVHPDLLKREQKTLFTETHRAMGLKWATDHLPEHFLPSARQALKYDPRKPKYLRIKQRLFEQGATVGGRQVIAGRNNDLVFTGRLRDILEMTAPHLVKATAEKVRIPLIGPKYFTLRPRRAGTARLAMEVLSVSRRHEKELGDAGNKGFVEKLNALRRAKVLTKRTTTK